MGRLNQQAAPQIGDRRYGDPWLLDDGFEDCEIVDSAATKLSDIVPKDGKRFEFKYEYNGQSDQRRMMLPVVTSKTNSSDWLVLTIRLGDIG